MLKKLTTTCARAFTDYNELETRMTHGLAFLEVVYTSSGISPPRRGLTTLQAQAPVVLPPYHFGASPKLACSLSSVAPNVPSCTRDDHRRQGPRRPLESRRGRVITSH